MRFSKLTAIFVAMLLCVFMASTAMAINVTNRSAEMDDFSACDRAGTIEMQFTQADWGLIAAEEAAGNYVLIRIALNGLSLPPSPRLPLLCRDIHGTVDGTALAPIAIPYTNDVAIQSIGVEISDVGGAAGPAANGIADAEIYVHGNDGDQYIEVFIVALDGAAANYDFDTDPPWFKIGLHEELLAVPDLETTAICAEVLDFSGVSTLTISNEATPNTITFSGDNEIGHFLTQTVTLADCDKTEQSLISCEDDDIIELCPLGGTPQSPACPTYDKCFTIEGDIPATGDIEITLRSNGAANGDNTQEGIYFSNITLYSEDNAAPPTVIVPATGPTFLQADGTASAGPVCTTWDREQVTLTIDAADVAADGNEIRFCVQYAVNPDEAVANTDVQFWLEASQIPCGNVITDVVTAASLIECAPGSDSMYFPYVLTDSGAWFTGIVVTNLGTSVTADDMEATLTITDSTGTMFTYTKSDFTTTVWAVILDNIIGEFSGTPAAGPAWLNVTTNFNVDGYSYLSNGDFGAGTLARIP